MDIEQAREFLREQMLAAAAATIPGQEPVVERDNGPSAPGAIFDGRSNEYTCYIKVAVGDPRDTRKAGEHVAEATRMLAEMGWQVDPVVDEGDHFRGGATRDGFDVEIRMWNEERALTFLGETPVFSLKDDPAAG